MPWCVAEFYPHRDYDNMSIQVVPSSWVQQVGKKLFTLFPPTYYSIAAVRRAVKEEKDPEEDWDALGLHYVTENFDSLTDARALEAEVADCSDTELEVFVGTYLGAQSKRRRKMKKLIYPGESSDSGTTGSIHDELPNRPSMTVLPQGAAQVSGQNWNGKLPGKGTRLVLRLEVPKRLESTVPAVHTPTKPISGQIVIEDASTSQQAAESRVFVSSPNTLSCSKEKTFAFAGMSICTPQQRTESIGRGNTIAAEAGPQVCSPEQNSSQARSFDGPSLKDVMSAIQKMNGQMVMEHTSLSKKIDALTVRLDAVLQQKGGASGASPYRSDYESLHELPATSETDLLAVEHDIKIDLEYRRFLVDYLKKRCSSPLPGSSSVTRCVNDCCIALLTNELATRYSMTGRSHSKTSFSAKFPNLIHAICLTVKEKGEGVFDPSIQEVRSRMGEWMRQAMRRTEAGKAARIAYYEAQKFGHVSALDFDF
ncbi:uncharacterized protein LOC124160607 [Ischnura elegans]|uniref:uncharacterized protein LOC124160607 n=1 Tax=Ischnura elegans TaxID=197161 RepID=UPI001ED8966E|nr:uncharacterized protein LOC124160607 [Ischnura elegans]